MVKIAHLVKKWFIWSKNDQNQSKNAKFGQKITKFGLKKTNQNRIEVQITPFASRYAILETHLFTVRHSSYVICNIELSCMLVRSTLPK